jgi:hypothetical protein
MLSHKFITLVRVRKDTKVSLKEGEVMILVQPEAPVQRHLDAQRELAMAYPVGSDFSEVIVARLEPKTPNLQFKTKAEVKAEEDQAKEFADQQARTSEESAKRQKAINDAAAKKEADEKAAKLAQMNRLHDSVREQKPL